LRSAQSHPASARYAKALLDSAKEQNVLEECYQQMQALLQLLKGAPSVNQFFIDPEIPAITKEKILDQILGRKVKALILRFLKLLAQKRKLGLFEQIHQSFESLYFKEKEILAVQILTAAALSESHVQKICEKCQKFTRKKILPRTEGKQDLIAGFQLKIGDQVKDFSIKNKLERFKKQVLLGF